MDKDQIEQRGNGTMGQIAIRCTDRKRPGSLPELRLTKGSRREEKGEGKEGSRGSSKKTTVIGGKTSCRGQENCATIPNNPSYSLKETGT
jgi:hypothetical protein